MENPPQSSERLSIDRTLVMGIMNVTPDSFSDGGRFLRHDNAVHRGLELIQQGVDLIDVGGESTRPGSLPIMEEAEIKRVLPVVKTLVTKAPVSIDTTKAAVAAMVLEAGAFLVNDVSGLTADPDMPRVIAEHDAHCCIMHAKGEPRTMQINPHYDDLIGEICDFLERQIEVALKAGVKQHKIWIDPGIGFGKTVEHNLQIIRELDQFKRFGMPILLGASRKSFIGAVLNGAPPLERVDGTIAACIIGMMNGANVLRVHDVERVVPAVRVAEAIMGR
ncbi:MAG: dihydropteroate synthase [Armatimonadota bacterium]